MKASPKRFLQFSLLASQKPVWASNTNDPFFIERSFHLIGEAGSVMGTLSPLFLRNHITGCSFLGHESTMAAIRVDLIESLGNAHGWGVINSYRVRGLELLLS